MRISRRSMFEEQTGSEDIETRVVSLIDLTDKVCKDGIETKKGLTKLVLDGDVFRKEANSQGWI